MSAKPYKIYNPGRVTGIKKAILQKQDGFSL